MAHPIWQTNMQKVAWFGWNSVLRGFRGCWFQIWTINTEINLYNTGSHLVALNSFSQFYTVFWSQLIFKSYDLDVGTCIGSLLYSLSHQIKVLNVFWISCHNKTFLCAFSPRLLCISNTYLVVCKMNWFKTNDSFFYSHYINYGKNVFTRII